MITYIDSSNRQDYTVLFNKASIKLGLTYFDKDVINPETGQLTTEKWMYYQDQTVEPITWKTRKCKLFDPNDESENANADADFDEEGHFLAVIGGQKVISTGISSLNDYFQHIHELAELAIGNGRSGTDPYFLRLPLDEPFLEINANTRAISVPSSLSRIAVQGDKYAEIVFFKIDRYYDAVDLATRHIYIEWEIPDGEGGVRKGVSRDFLKDTQSEKDKIIFGWIIDDTLTANVGTIRFAVRFVEWADHSDSVDEGAELAYSFSSLPAQMSVVASLNYSLFENAEDRAKAETHLNYINTYLENSDPDSADDTSYQAAADPVIVQDLDDRPEGVDLNPQNLTLELVVEAYSRDGGIISYNFMRQTESPAEGKKMAQGLGAETRMHEVSADDALADLNSQTPSGHIYYLKKATDSFYTMASKQNIIDRDPGDIVAFKEAYIIVNQPGYYTANIRNTVGGKKATVIPSSTLYVPFAEAAVESTELIPSFVLSNQEYTVFRDESIVQNRLTNWRSNLLIKEVGEVGDDFIMLGTQESGPIFTVADDRIQDMFYQWYKADTRDDLLEDNINAFAIPGATSSTYRAHEPGYYLVTAKNKFNNNEAPIVRSHIIWITEMPEIPAVDWDAWDQVITIGDTAAITNIPISWPAGEVHFEWHKITAGMDDDPVAAGDLLHPGSLTGPEGLLTPVNGTANVPFEPVAAGDYYFILSNTLNGATVYYSSALPGQNGDRIIRVEVSGEGTVSITHEVTYTIETTGENIPEEASAVLPAAPSATTIEDEAEIPIPEEPAMGAVINYPEEEPIGTWTFGGWVANQETFAVTGTWAWAAIENSNTEDPSDNPNPGE